MNRHPRPPQLFPVVLVMLALLLGGCTGDSDNGGAPAGASPSGSTSSDPGDAGSAGPQALAQSYTTLPPRSYQFSVLANAGVEPPDALVKVPSGFLGGADWYVVSPDGDAFLGMWTVGKVQRDACLRPRHDVVTPGPSVDDLADALVAQKSTRASVPKPVNLAGYQGLYVELASPHDISKCDQDPRLWGDPGGRAIYSDDQVDLVWILDVDGQRIVINAAHGPTSTASERDKLTSMVESLDFVAAQRG
jgi:hypothetical protein